MIQPQVVKLGNNLQPGDNTSRVPITLSMSNAFAEMNLCLLSGILNLDKELNHVRPSVSLLYTAKSGVSLPCMYT